MAMPVSTRWYHTNAVAQLALRVVLSFVNIID